MRRALTAVALCLSSAAAAQDRMSLDHCVQSLEMVTALFPSASPADVTVSDEGWCVLSSAGFDVDQYTRLQFGSLQWRGSDMERLTEETLPPRALDVVAQGVSFIGTGGDPVLSYLHGIQNSRSTLGFGFSVRWDGVQNAVFLDEGYVTFDEDNRIEATARVDGLDLTNPVAIQSSAGSAGLAEFTLKSDFNGWFEEVAVLPLGYMLLQPGGAAPETQVAALKQQTVSVINGLPDTLMAPQSRAAVVAFVSSLPTPQGTVELQLTADPVIGAVNVMPFMMVGTEPDWQAVLDVALNRVTLVFNWTPMSGDLQ